MLVGGGVVGEFDQLREEEPDVFVELHLILAEGFDIGG